MEQMKSMTCVICPLGCTLCVKLSQEGSVENVTGNSCKRGEVYAVSECTHPARTLTTTIRTQNGAEPLVSVKSSQPIPKELLFACMDILNQKRVKAPILIGEVLVANIGNTGIDIIATRNVRGKAEKQSPLPRKVPVRENKKECV